MLPFLKLKQDAASSSPVDAIQRKPDDEDSFDSLEVAAEDLCHAIHSKDMKAIASALRAAFELLDSEPHVEGPHTNE